MGSPVTTNYRLGETNIASNGLKMTIINYRRCNDIDIKFEDDIIVYHKTYHDFQHGMIKHPNIKSLDKQPHDYHIGETNINKFGHEMTIINWINNKNIDVQFDDGIIVYHRKYNNFKKGIIRHPNDKKSYINVNYIGKKVTKPNGEVMEIIKYRNSNDFDIKFNDGTILKHCDRISDFNRGYIKNPTNVHIGEEIIARNGLRCKIIKWKNNRNVTVQFEDGIETIIDYKTFTQGTIKHPNIDIRNKKGIDKYVGKTYIANNGMSYKVLSYIDSQNILIEFEDNTQVMTSVSCISSGHIKNPNYTLQNIRIGESNISSIGLKMSIYKYHSAKNIDIKFEDGYIATNKTYKNFLKGMIEHKWPYQINNIIIEKPAYLYNNIGNFYCTCTLCKYKDIMNLDEIKSHICKKVLNNE